MNTKYRCFNREAPCSECPEHPCVTIPDFLKETGQAVYLGRYKLMSRHDDALFIQAGACNPAGIARSLVKAIDECSAEGMDTTSIRSDPAVQLITHQLAYLMSVRDFEDDPIGAYKRAMQACYAKAGDLARATAKIYAPTEDAPSDSV
jgi:hypothetical protein